MTSFEIGSRCEAYRKLLPQGVHSRVSGAKSTLCDIAACCLYTSLLVVYLLLCLTFLTFMDVAPV